MKFFKILLGLLAAVGSAFAGYQDLFFQTSSTGRFLMNVAFGTPRGTSADGTIENAASVNDVRIRILDPKDNPAYPMGFELQRPFFILDGIYLNNDGLRTLSLLQDEVDQLGMLPVLRELGYTPILVQFGESVNVPLEENGIHFKKLLQYMNRNVFFGLSDVQDGFIVMGVSQGGVLGRYGAYLYDLERDAADAPIKLFASLDSPHQGAVVPMSLHYTIDFWATKGGSASAESFRELLNGPGAQELLLYQYDPKTSSYQPNTSENRFLFGKYRQAANYKKFPTVLLAQGQMKGVFPSERSTLFELNRKTSKFGAVVGRATSRAFSTVKEGERISRNRVYQMTKQDDGQDRYGNSRLDLVQGSTYPFAKTLYQQLREGFVDAMPKSMKIKKGWFSVTFNSSWDDDKLYKESSTFIPVASAMDMICDGKMAIQGECAFTASAAGFPFENPKDRSTGSVTFAVDPTHPRFLEGESGRHVEMPREDSTLNYAVLRGIQTDIWRILCSMAKYDYDSEAKAYRNPNLNGIFDPRVSCLDASAIPDLFLYSGLVNDKRFGFARYDYQQEATEMDPVVEFNVPAGWHKVGLFDNGRKIQEGSYFEVELEAVSGKTSWMKAELLLTTTANGTGQIQLQEKTVALKGGKQVLRWSMPQAKGSLTGYRWLRLVINSDGGTVRVSNPRMVLAHQSEKAVGKIQTNVLYPQNQFSFQKDDERVLMQPYSDGFGNGVELAYYSIGLNAFVNFGEPKNLAAYKNLRVTYWPGTCLATKVYFDSHVKGATLLEAVKLNGNFADAVIPLEKIINQSLSPDGGLSASRLNIRSAKAGERCVIKEVKLE